MPKFRTRLRIVSLNDPLYVCGEHVSRGYSYRTTVDVLAKHVSIEPCLPHNRCGIYTNAGKCNVSASFKLTYWQVKETQRDPFNEIVVNERMQEHLL